MKEFVSKPNSWHRKLAELHIKYTVPYISEREGYKQEFIEDKMYNNFCLYFRGVMIYLFKIALMAFVSMWFLFGSLYPTLHGVFIDGNVIEGTGWFGIGMILLFSLPQIILFIAVVVGAGYLTYAGVCKVVGASREKVSQAARTYVASTKV